MSEPTPLHPRRRYTRKDRVTAMIAAEASSTARAAEELRIPESTIRYWMDSPKFAELRAKTQADRAEGYGLTALMAQARLIELIPTMEPKDLITLMGVATDKAQLLSGAATSRTETRELTEALNDHERQSLRSAIDEFLRQGEAVEA